MDSIAASYGLSDCEVEVVRFFRWLWIWVDHTIEIITTRKLDSRDNTHKIKDGETDDSTCVRCAIVQTWVEPV